MKIDGSNFTWIATAQAANSGETQRKPLGIERTSGHSCPQTGYWQMMGAATTTVVNIKKGTIMPYHQGQPTGWQLKEYDLSGGLDD